ncbi:ABC transporter [Aspergillus sclerotialis]|uniref:ABC transporter n=1 Tax=Aspergillus sclerotialis TaxID=2070753 RepID=A0A3A2ZFB4_9EURO|nr:ABC transporter [Aspergillus sclerotialis]
MSGDGSRNGILQTVDLLSKSFEADKPLEPVQAIRKIRHEQNKNQLFLAQKNAGLKSGSRGFQARKDLKSTEAKVESSLAQ